VTNLTSVTSNGAQAISCVQAVEDMYCKRVMNIEWKHF